MNENVNVVSNVQPAPKKSFPVWLIIVIVVGVITFIVGLVIAILLIVGTSTMKEIRGEWTCNDKLGLTIGMADLTMTSGDDTHIKATYTIENFEIDDNYHKYTINAKAVERIISGQKYTGDYTTQYQIVVDPKDKNNMVMMNTVSYSTYNCTKK